MKVANYEKEQQQSFQQFKTANEAGNGWNIVGRDKNDLTKKDLYKQKSDLEAHIQNKLTEIDEQEKIISRLTEKLSFYET
jgi:hypothetical protein